MDPRTAKLVAMGVNPEAAESLVAAGIDTPRKIKTAKVADLKTAKAYGDAKVKGWRKKK